MIRDSTRERRARQVPPRKRDVHEVERPSADAVERERGLTRVAGEPRDLIVEVFPGAPGSAKMVTFDRLGRRVGDVGYAHAPAATDWC